MFCGLSENEDGRAGLWLAKTFSNSFCNRWTEFIKTWQEGRSQHPLPSLDFSGRLENQDCPPGLWLAETFSASSLKLQLGDEQNLTGNKISASSTKLGLGFFWRIRKPRWLSWPLIGWEIFDFFSETAAGNSTKLDRKLDLNVLYQGCFFWWIGKPRWPSWHLISWNIFDNFCNRWTEFSKTWQEARSQRPLSSLGCFSGRSENQDDRPGLLLAEAFSTSSLKPLRGIQRNRKQEFNVFCQVWIFGPIRKPKCRPGLWLADTISTYFRNRWPKFIKTWQEARS